MKSVAQLALEAASGREVSYADARVGSIRSRALSTKNGRVGHASESGSFGIGIRGREYLLYPLVDLANDLHQILAGALEILELFAQEPVPFLERRELFQCQRIDAPQ